MNYRYAVADARQADLSSGKVLYHCPGRPALPVRLAEEVFCRCVASAPPSGPEGRVVLYDPCCGAAYHLTVLVLLHGDRIERAIGSDIDTDVVEVARRNLALTRPEGLEARIRELRRMAASYGKPSHAEALESAERLRGLLPCGATARAAETLAFAADALDGAALVGRLGSASIDVVVSDVPYGEHSRWRLSGAPEADRTPTWMLLEALRAVLRPGGVVGLVSDKQQKAAHEAYERVERLQVGKRRVTIVKLRIEPGRE